MTGPRTKLDRKRRRRRAVWVGLALLIVAGLALTVFFGAAHPEVEVARVTRGTYVRYVAEDGRARIRDRYVVSAPLAGTLERVTLRVGDRVGTGDVVATLYPVPSALLDARSRAELEERVGAAAARLAAARATQRRVEASRKQAQRDFARTQGLARSGAVAPRALELAESALTVATQERDAALHAVHFAEHELEQARAALERSKSSASVPFELRAPVSGCILRVVQNSETVVAPGTPIVEIGDPSDLEVVVDLLSTDAVRVEPGMSAEITGWGGAESLRAKVRTVEPVARVHVSALGVEEERVDVIVDPVQNDAAWKRVGDGYRVDVRIPVERLTKALRLPTSALFRAGEQWRAFVVKGDVARVVDVGVASYGPSESVVNKGLRDGDVVVLQPPASLADGARVKVRTTAGAGSRSAGSPGH